MDEMDVVTENSMTPYRWWGRKAVRRVEAGVENQEV